ncbi:DUF5681 domain-containing protein [Enterovirga rhinocerotis]|uniref:DUF5681 domain-containing protein n=1 Tax=Enterovirga rhinocerotis TaxID=1339210 RepID=A0A4R7BN02_9HYPH|nr:DUF5681 domain-containing protein [Enterovirga rhinocerotis]TDR85286.1 hypothetical protein EV668_4838 [Enterovirga rhinocerotis]
MSSKKKFDDRSRNETAEAERRGPPQAPLFPIDFLGGKRAAAEDGHADRPGNEGPRSALYDDGPAGRVGLFPELREPAGDMPELRAPGPNSDATGPSEAVPPLPAEYKVGKNRPPLHTRFKKGQVANPRGRAAGSRNIAAALKKELKQRVKVVEGGRRKTLAKEELIVKKLVNRAMEGDRKSIEIVLTLSRQVDDTGAKADELSLSQDDALALESYLKSMPAREVDDEG